MRGGLRRGVSSRFYFDFTFTPTRAISPSFCLSRRNEEWNIFEVPRPVAESYSPCTSLPRYNTSAWLRFISYETRTETAKVRGLKTDLKTAE